MRANSEAVMVICPAPNFFTEGRAASAARFSSKKRIPLYSRQPSFSRKLKCLERCPPRPCRISVRHDMNGNSRLFFALIGHAFANFLQEPRLELFARLKYSTANDQRIRIEGVDHLVEKQTQRMCLHAENLLAHRVALAR